jgi:hypothetical protein
MEKVLFYLAKLEAKLYDLKIKKNILFEKMEVVWNEGRKNLSARGELMPKPYLDKYNAINKEWTHAKDDAHKLERKINVIKEMLNEIGTTK